MMAKGSYVLRVVLTVVEPSTYTLFIAESCKLMIVRVDVIAAHAATYQVEFTANSDFFQ